MEFMIIARNKQSFHWWVSARVCYGLFRLDYRDQQSVKFFIGPFNCYPWLWFNRKADETYMDKQQEEKNNLGWLEKWNKWLYLWTDLVPITNKIFDAIRVRATGYVVLGFDDPYLTGLVSAHVSTWMNVKDLQDFRFLPAFDQEVLQGQLRLKININLWAVVALCSGFVVTRIRRRIREKIKLMEVIKGEYYRKCSRVFF